MKRVAAVMVFGLVTSGLAGCATYAPAPLQVGAFAMPTVQRADLPADGDPHVLLRLALAHDPAVAAARATLAAAENSRKAAGNLPPLSLSLTAEYSRDADAQKPWLYSGLVGIPLDIGARRNGRVTAADLAAVKARYALAEAVWGVRQRLYQALNDRAAAEQTIGLNQALLDQRSAYLEVIRQRVTRGEDAQGLAAQAALDVSGARQGLAQATALRTEAANALAGILRIGPDAGLPTTTLADPAPLDAAQLTGMIDRMPYARSDVLLAVTDYDVAENDLRLAVAAQYPDMTIQPGYTWERGQVKLPVSFNLTLPPLDGNRAAIAAAQATRLAAGKTLEDCVATAHTAAVQAAASYNADLATAQTIASQDIPAAQDMAQRASRLTSAGESDQAEALLARINATQVQINLWQAQRTARNERLALEDALHQPFDAVDTQILTDAVTPDAPKNEAQK